MIIILHILNKQEASWLLVDKKKVLAQADFILQPDQDTLLPELDYLLFKAEKKLQQIRGIVLSVTDSSLTQIKIATAVINTLAWQLDIPVVGDFSSPVQLKMNLDFLLVKLSKQKKFRSLKAVYQRPVKITLSKKKSKFVIKK